MAQLDHDLTELFAMREVLEVPAARWAAERQDTAALARVQEALDSLERALQRDPLDYEELQRLDAAFHLRIVQAAGNRLLEQTQSVLHELLATGTRTTLEVEGRIAKSRRDHQRILAALLRGDGQAAAKAARAHVRGVRDAATARMAAAKAAAESTVPTNTPRAAVRSPFGHSPVGVAPVRITQRPGR